MFHLKIAEASKNTVLKSLMLIITPDIINNFIKLDICKDGRIYNALEEHEIILKHIIAQEPDAAIGNERELEQELDDEEHADRAVDDDQPDLGSDHPLCCEREEHHDQQHEGEVLEEGCAATRQHLFEAQCYPCLLPLSLFHSGLILWRKSGTR